MNNNIQERLMGFYDDINELCEGISGISSEIEAISYEEECQYYNIDEDIRGSDKSLELLQAKRDLSKVFYTLDSASKILKSAQEPLGDVLSSSIDFDQFKDDIKQLRNNVFANNNLIDITSITLDCSEEDDELDSETTLEDEIDLKIWLDDIVDDFSLAKLIKYVMSNNFIKIIIRDSFPTEYKYLSRKFVREDFKTAQGFLMYIDAELPLLRNNYEVFNTYMSTFFSNSEKIVDMIYLKIYEDALYYDFGAARLKSLLGDNAFHYKGDNINYIQSEVNRIKNKWELY